MSRLASDESSTEFRDGIFYRFHSFFLASVPLNQMLAARIDLAGSLIEAGNWIRQFKDKTIVVCITGGFMDSEQAVQDCLSDLLFMSTVGVRTVVVHGGGNRVVSALERAGKKPRFVDGQAVFDPDAAPLLEEILARQLNESLASEYEQLGGRAMTLNFESTPVLSGRLKPVEIEPGTDGAVVSVAEVTGVDRLVIDNLCYAGQVPVVPAMCLTDDDCKLAVSEVDAAVAVAGELNGEKLVILTDRDLAADFDLPTAMARDAAQETMAASGIDPQVRHLIRACLQALDSSVRQTHLVGTDGQHGLLLEVFTDAGVGIEVRGD